MAQLSDSDLMALEVPLNDDIDDLIATTWRPQKRWNRNKFKEFEGDA